MGVRIVHTNDLHGKLTAELADRLHDLRGDYGLLFDTGDCIKAGNLAVPLRSEEAWSLLARAGCDAGTLGNRESHMIEAAFRRKLEGLSHPIVCSNLFHKGRDLVFPRAIQLDRDGLTIGVVGCMVPMVTRRMASLAASAYLWEPALPFVRQAALELRGAVDLVVALTHIGHRHDLELAESCPEIDVILGGHSHTILERPLLVGKTWVCQGGSHARFAGVYDWNPGGLSGGLVSLR